jgi:hypothetical protein
MARRTVTLHERDAVAAEQERRRRSEVVAYVAVNAFLAGVWVVTGFGYFWPGWFLAAGGLWLSVVQWHSSRRREDRTVEDVAPQPHRGR